MHGCLSNGDRVSDFMATDGAVLHSSQWAGWVPGCCSGDGDLAASSFTVSSLGIQGCVVQGPEHTERSSPCFHWKGDAELASLRRTRWVQVSRSGFNSTNSVNVLNSKSFDVDLFTKYGACCCLWMVIMRIPFFGGTADGDADKNMILCDQFFVSLSDSLALIELGIHEESWN